jgi:phosphoribosylglycinamide formyltransferase 1
VTSLKRIIVAVSGGGRSLQNLLDLQKDAACLYEVVGVISSSSSCRAVDIAVASNLAVFVSAFDKKAMSLVKSLREWVSGLCPDLCVLAGFIRLFPLDVVSCPIINIHPALLPKYGGKGMYGQKVHDAVYKDKELITGATVHFVNERYDEGAIIAQIEVDVGQCKSAEDIQAKVFRAECQLLPQAITGLLKGELPLTDGRVYRASYRETDRL